MRHADKVRRLEVRANADTPDDARHAIHRGAQGVGLCRTEHMFLGERKQFVQNLILAASDDEREAPWPPSCRCRRATSSPCSRR